MGWIRWLSNSNKARCRLQLLALPPATRSARRARRDEPSLAVRLVPAEELLDVVTVGVAVPPGATSVWHGVGNGQRADSLSAGPVLASGSSTVVPRCARGSRAATPAAARASAAIAAGEFWRRQR